MTGYLPKFLTPRRSSNKRHVVREMYERLHKAPAPDLPLGPYRHAEYDAYVLGDVVEKL
jgi:hypothetical protein